MADKEHSTAKKGRLSRYFNVRQWVGTDHLRNPFEFLKKILVTAFVVPPETTEKEDFLELVDKLGLTSEQLRKKKNAFLRLCIVFCILAFLVVVYAVFHVSFGHYRVFFPSIVLSVVCLAFAFRYHFWYMQIKTQRLGCSFQEWCDYVFSGRKK
jgi:intracellular multiplication protein IcmV